MASCLARRVGGLEMFDLAKESLVRLARRVGGLEI